MNASGLWHGFGNILCRKDENKFLHLSVESEQNDLGCLEDKKDIRK